MSQLLNQRPNIDSARFELVVYTRQQSRLYPLFSGTVLGLGRGTENQVQIEDISVSRLHARLHIGEHVEIEDLGSANGTTLVRALRQRQNNEETDASSNFRVTAGIRAVMVPGDVLRVGGVIVVLQRKGRTSIPAPSPSSRVAGPAILVDSEMRRVYDLAARAAASDISVLILGETGVGKEVMAETIHRRSPRADAPFLRLNCAALPESLLEGELFGHERGAFTGAHATKQGLIESTDHGTVFLDEIGELPLGTQAKLLRVLEERTVLRLGSTKSKQVDVRFVTATNRDLSREVRAGRFRGDLYYRISGIVMRVPPLRHRRAEIQPLAAHFLRQFCARSNQPEPLLNPDAVEVLCSYDWPGNVRELRNVMERAALLTTDGQIHREHVLLEPNIPDDELADADDFEAITKVSMGLDPRTRQLNDPYRFSDPQRSPPNVPMQRPSLPEPAPISTIENAAFGPFAEIEGESERDRIIRALESCGGNQTRAAKLLGVSRRTLINRLEQFQLPRPKKG